MSAAPDHDPIRERLAEILGGYREDKVRKGVKQHGQARAGFSEAQERLQGSAPVSARPEISVKESSGTGEWAHVPWIAFLDRRETDTPASGVTVMLLFRADMSAIYLTLMQGVAGAKEKHGGMRRARAALKQQAEALRPEMADLERHGFQLGGALALGGATRDGRKVRSDYEDASIAHKLYEAGALPDDSALLADLDAVLTAYQRYVAARQPGAFERLAALGQLTGAIAARGFVFEPWQVAAYVTALRTKPFVILAGVSGTGKSRLPALVAELTGGEATLLPVRPDWTDSSDVLGYTDLGGRFRPGRLLEVARGATARPDQHHVCVLDEMNLARVEHYFAEVLSRIEDRREAPGGGFAGALLGQRPAGDDAPWADVGLPPNLALVGTVNMDETTHGFSRKVLDRAFSLEISDIDLSVWSVEGAAVTPPAWPVHAFHPRAVRLGALTAGEDEKKLVEAAIAALTEVNEVLRCAQLQVGYRVRDEVALFLVHAQEVLAAFKTRDGVGVAPLDLALLMKILPASPAAAPASARW